jgi:multiple sugar transport system ATP-binding protein
VAGVRPEDLVPLELPDASPTRIEAVLELVEPIGNESFLNLKFGASDIVARVPPRFAPPPGSRVEFAYDARRLHYFDPADGRRIDEA